MLIGALIAAAASFAAISPTVAQPDPNRVPETMNFDLWCQGEASLPAERCDKRTPEDQSAFEARRASLERYEIPSRSAQYDQARVNRDIMNNDPIDNPHKDDLGAQEQYPNTQVAPAQPKSTPVP